MWQTLLNQIAETGLSETAIARRLGCGQATIWRMRNGQADNPSWKLGEAIRGLHQERCSVPAAHDEQEAA
jgi:hypothetical protein